MLPSSRSSLLNMLSWNVRESGFVLVLYLINVASELLNRKYTINLALRYALDLELGTSDRPSN